MFSLFSKTQEKHDWKAGKEKFNQSLVNSAVEQQEIVTFNLTNEHHMNKVRACTAALNEHLPVLQSRDKQIAIGFTVAGAALALSSIIPFGLTIAMSGVAYGSYYLGGRDEPYKKFNTALEELAHCCDKALSDDTADRVKDPDIKAMLKALAPFVTKEDLINIMGSEEEANRVSQALKDLNEHEATTPASEASTPSLNIPKPVPYKLATKDELNYHLYGYQQGGTLATLANVAFIYMKKAFIYICNLVNDAFNKTPDAEVASTPRP